MICQNDGFPPRQTGAAISRAQHRCAALGQPAFAAPIMLDVTIVPAPCCPKAQIKFFDVLVLAQGLSAAIKHDPAILQDIAIVGNPQSHRCILLGEEKTDSFLLVQPLG